jgi:hypothetical protein
MKGINIPAIPAPDPLGASASNSIAVFIRPAQRRVSEGVL